MLYALMKVNNEINECASRSRHDLLLLSDGSMALARLLTLMMVRVGCSLAGVVAMKGARFINQKCWSLVTL